MDDSISIVQHFCHNCNQQIDIITRGHKCCECNSSFVEDLSNSCAKAKATKESAAVDDNNPNKSPEKAIDCTICLLPMVANTEEPLVLLKCEHKFHKKCIKVWFGEHNTCPLCRARMDVASYVTPIRGVRLHHNRDPRLNRMLRARVILEEMFTDVTNGGRLQVSQASTGTRFHAIPNGYDLAHAVTYRQPLRVATVSGQSRVVPDRRRYDRDDTDGHHTVRRWQY